MRFISGTNYIPLRSSADKMDLGTALVIECATSEEGDEIGHVNMAVLDCADDEGYLRRVAEENDAEMKSEMLLSAAPFVPPEIKDDYSMDNLSETMDMSELAPPTSTPSSTHYWAGTCAFVVTFPILHALLGVQWLFTARELNRTIIKILESRSFYFRPVHMVWYESNSIWRPRADELDNSTSQKSLTDQEIDEKHTPSNKNIKKTFDLYDPERCGAISGRDFVSLCIALCYTQERKEIQDVLLSADVDGNDFLFYDEVPAVMSQSIRFS